MGLYTPRVEVSSPSFTPAPFGLMSVADQPDDDNAARGKGALIRPELCDPANVYVDVCPPAARPAKEAMEGGFRASDPITLYAREDCSTVGVTLDEAKRRVGTVLTNGEGRTLERLFWTGGAGAAIHPHLAHAAAPVEVTTLGVTAVLQPQATIVDGTGLRPAEALRALESALGDCYGGLGVIHMPKGDASYLGDRLGVDGSRLVTKVGTRVAAGAGYPGTSAAGVDPDADQSWWFATGSVAVRRTPVRFPASSESEVVDRAVNTRTLIAERQYTIVWDCCLLAVLVDFGA